MPPRSVAAQRTAQRRRPEPSTQHPWRRGVAVSPVPDRGWHRPANLIVVPCGTHGRTSYSSRITAGTSTASRGSGSSRGSGDGPRFRPIAAKLTLENRAISPMTSTCCAASVRRLRADRGPSPAVVVLTRENSPRLAALPGINLAAMRFRPDQPIRSFRFHDIDEVLPSPDVAGRRLGMPLTGYAQPPTSGWRMPTPRSNRTAARNPVVLTRLQRFARSVDGRLGTLRRRVRAIEVTLDPLVDHEAHVERELLNHDQRLTRLERLRRRRPARASSAAR